MQVTVLEQREDQDMRIDDDDWTVDVDMAGYVPRDRKSVDGTYYTVDMKAPLTPTYSGADEEESR